MFLFDFITIELLMLRKIAAMFVAMTPFLLTNMFSSNPMEMVVIQKVCTPHPIHDRIYKILYVKILCRLCIRVHTLVLFSCIWYIFFNEWYQIPCRRFLPHTNFISLFLKKKNVTGAFTNGTILVPLSHENTHISNIKDKNIWNFFFFMLFRNCAKMFSPITCAKKGQY